MNITLNGDKENCCLIFEGAMTCEFSCEMEDRLIDCMRRYRHLDVDLSAVSEVDLCGLHLLGVLRSFGDSAIRIVAASPVVDAALARISRGAALRRNGAQGKAERTGEHGALPRAKPGASAV